MSRLLPFFVNGQFLGMREVGNHEPYVVEQVITSMPTVSGCEDAARELREPCGMYTVTFTRRRFWRDYKGRIRSEEEGMFLDDARFIVTKEGLLRPITDPDVIETEERYEAARRYYADIVYRIEENWKQRQKRGVCS